MQTIYLVSEWYTNGLGPRVIPLKCFHYRIDAKMFAEREIQERIDNPRVNQISGVVASPHSYEYKIKEMELH